MRGWDEGWENLVGDLLLVELEDGEGLRIGFLPGAFCQWSGLMREWCSPNASPASDAAAP